MGNAGSGRGSANHKHDADCRHLDRSPLAFNSVHGENIRISEDGRSATRVESFCKGLAFSHRPVAPLEKVYLQFSEVSTSWSGVLRFGFTGIDPAFLNPASLPRYACPDLTNKPLNWAKALAEQYAEYMYSLYFYYTKSGDVYYGVNNEDKGLFFSGVNTNCSLWVMLDIYGNTKTVEFTDPPRPETGTFLLNNQITLNNGQSQFAVDGSSHFTAHRHNNSNVYNNRDIYSNLSQQVHLPPGGNNRLSAPILNGWCDHFQAVRDGGMGGAMPRSSSLDVPPNQTDPIPLHHPPHQLSPLHFHDTHGENVRLSNDGDVAFRIEEEYCNAYVFTNRPLRPGEAVVIQIQKVELMYLGTLAFGLTSCDPGQIGAAELPDDSDDLLDRKEYWVVNKDVGGVPGVGDELSFLLTRDGEVVYSKNCRQLAVLMHVDVSMPLWVFFDVYGNTSKIKILGAMSSADATALGRSSSLRPTSLPAPLPVSSIQFEETNNTATSGYAVGASSPQLVVSLPPLSSASTFEGDGAVPSDPSSSLSAPLTEDELQHERNAFAENVSLGNYASVGGRSRPPGSSAGGTPRSVADASAVAADAANDSGGSGDLSAECTVCYERAVDSVLYTCGHCCMCYDCAWECKQTRGGLCPICRAPIRDVIRIYRS